LPPKANRLVWLPEARDDTERLYRFLVGKNPLVAAKAMRLILDGAERLRDFPELGRPMDDDTGRRELFLPFGASAYVLRYRADGATLAIIRVWHGREGR
jgi:plasmid stabilization system protein ParE